MRWTDIADWIGPTRNEGDGDGTPLEPADAISGVVGVVVHIQQGSEAGTEAWQRNPAAEVSSHFLSPKTGRGRQMVDTQDRAWAEAAGNSHWLSIENEGVSGQTLTPNQLEFNAQVLAKAHVLHGVPLQVSTSPSIRGLGHHSMGGVSWGNHPDCPGDPVIAQKAAIVARAQQMVTPQVEGESIEEDTLFLAKANDATVYLCDGFRSRPIPGAKVLADIVVLWETGAIRLQTGEGNAVSLTTDWEPYGSHPRLIRTGWYEGAYGPLDVVTPSPGGIAPGTKLSVTVDSVT